MRLKEFRVREFRSIWDSGTVKIDGQTTCLVGKNEGWEDCAADGALPHKPYHFCRCCVQ